MEFPLLEACLPAYLFVDIYTIMFVCTAVFDTFQPLSCDVLASIIHKSNRTTCALLRVYNDSVTTIGRDNGAMLVLLDLSAAFDTIDHDNLFCILEKYVGICGNALKLIKSYFSNRTQLVQIDNVLSDFANIICGVPQGSVLGPLKLCLFLLPLSAILRYYNIGYHVYADDIQLYVSFKCKQLLKAISKLNSCLADIRRWMITNQLKINDLKTEFIVFRSPQLKCDLSGLSVNVGESMITQSSKVRDMGVIFDQFLNSDDHITAICRSTHFSIRNIVKIRNLLSYDACSTIILEVHSPLNSFGYWTLNKYYYFI